MINNSNLEDFKDLPIYYLLYNKETESLLKAMLIISYLKIFNSVIKSLLTEGIILPKRIK